jgi:hypothetical protein
MNRKLPGRPRPVEMDPRFLEIEQYDIDTFEPLLAYAPANPKRADKSAPRLGLPPRPTWLRRPDGAKSLNKIAAVYDLLPLRRRKFDRG